MRIMGAFIEIYASFFDMEKYYLKWLRVLGYY